MKINVGFIVNEIVFKYIERRGKKERFHCKPDRPGLIHIFGLFIQENDYIGVNRAAGKANNSFIML